ncbi:hypothetical protein [Desulfosporosinus sp.]|uniref:hypothetical protein n=1 Tax=Desulfosporosinus sp. TaxID=157907 RepID=UPI0026198413|nr:hypothetical protein [Desulfosporosinus sp.]
MTNLNHGYGPITTNADDCITEIEYDLDENGEDQEHGFIRANLPKLKKSLELLPIAGDIHDATAIAVFGPYMIVAEEMTQEAYDKMPEFDGY